MTMKQDLSDIFPFTSQQLNPKLKQLLEQSPYNKQSPGYLTLIEGKDKEPLLSFVPNPLPPNDWVVPPEVFVVLANAENALKKLETIASQSHLLPSMLIAPLILEDIKLLSRENENIGKTLYMGDYIRQLFKTIRDECSLPFSMARFSQWHQGIFTGPNWQHRGLFRTECLVFTRRENEHLSYYFTPPYEPMLQCMQDLESFMNEDQQHHPLIKLALFFYQFLAIHPFGDGNGRMTRFFTTLNLIQLGYLTKPYFFIGPYLNANRKAYIHSLDQVRYHAKWDVWATYFLTAIEETALALADRLERIEAIFQNGVNILLSRDTAYTFDSETAQNIMLVLFKMPLGDAAYWCQATPTLSAEVWGFALEQLHHAQLLMPRDNDSESQAQKNDSDLSLGGYSPTNAQWAMTPLVERLNAPLFPCSSAECSSGES